MGRKRLNRSKEELDEMNRKRRNLYYERHKEEERKESLERYYNNKKIEGGEKEFKFSDDGG